MFFFSIITHKGGTNDAVASVGNTRLCADLGTHADWLPWNFTPLSALEEKLQGAS